jgi:2-polyprenyl-3-methyl-5-hydroxy-6-metoxy-1,4-benzoquinol methylase
MQPRTDTRWSPVGRTMNRQDYYTSRPVECGYEDYWGTVVDPDGNVRQRISEEERRNYLENVAEELAFIQGLPPGKILDVGCGPGWLLDAVGPSWMRLGMDIVPEAMAEMDRLGIISVPELEMVNDDWADVVVCYHVIEHIADPIDFIGDIRRVLRPGGWLILGTPDFDSPCAQRFGDNYRMLHDKTHCSLFTLESLHRFLRDQAFTIQHVRFPFPRRYATPENFARWNDIGKVSPAWPGNWLTCYCQR